MIATSELAQVLFTTRLQESDHPSPGQVRAAIAERLRGRRHHPATFTAFAARVAQEAGDHPEAYAARMRWALNAVSRAYALPATPTASAPATASVPAYAPARAAVPSPAPVPAPLSAVASAHVPGPVPASVPGAVRPQDVQPAPPGTQAVEPHADRRPARKRGAHCRTRSRASQRGQVRAATAPQATT